MPALARIEGMTVEQTTPLEREVVARVVVRDLRLKYAVSDSRSHLAVQRQIEDAIRVHQKNHQDTQRTLEGTLTQISRAEEDFSGAILDLTEVKSLTNVDHSHRKLSFYIARDCDIYEAHIEFPINIDEGPSVVGPVKTPYLNETNFADKGFLKRFAEQSRGIEANAYFISNPSKIPDVEVLVYQAFFRYMECLHEEKDKAAAAWLDQAKENPISAMVSSIKGGVRRLQLRSLFGKRGQE